VVRLALPGHTEKINAVRFLSAADAGAPILFATAATDKTVRVWRLSFEHDDIAAEVVAVLEGHTDSVTGLVDMVDAHGSRVIVSVAADHTARLWECKKGNGETSIWEVTEGERQSAAREISGARSLSV
jgi:WD40 repeat protein